MGTVSAKYQKFRGVAQGACTLSVYGSMPPEHKSQNLPIQYPNLKIYM